MLLKGIRILGFEFRGFGSHAADEMARNEAEVLELLRTKRVLPHIGAAFPLDATAEALRYVGDGRAIGKVILDVAGPKT